MRRPPIPQIWKNPARVSAARAQFSHVDIYKANFKPMKATMSGRDTRVRMKLVADATTDSVVGCHIVGDGVAEMVQVLDIWTAGHGVGNIDDIPSTVELCQRLKAEYRAAAAVLHRTVTGIPIGDPTSSGGRDTRAIA